MATPRSLYDELDVTSTASDVEIRRAYRNLVTKTHPDRGGDPVAFKRIQQAYEVLSNKEKVGCLAPLSRNTWIEHASMLYAACLFCVMRLEEHVRAQLPPPVYP